MESLRKHSLNYIFSQMTDYFSTLSYFEEVQTGSYQ